MSVGWGVLAALCAIVVPMGLAWWLLGPADRRHRRGGSADRVRRGKIP